MSKINIECNCGEILKTKDKDYDVQIHGESILHEKVEYPKCKSKYEIQLALYIE